MTIDPEVLRQDMAALAAVESGAIDWSEVPASLRAEADRCAGLALARLGVSGG